MGGIHASQFTVKPDTFTDGQIIAKSIMPKKPEYDDKWYDGTTATVLWEEAQITTSQGLVAGDDVHVTSTGYYEDAQAGFSKFIDVTYTYTGTDVGNYNLPSTDQTSGNIYQVELTVIGTTIASTKVYDQNTTCAVLNAGSFSNSAAIIPGDVVRLEATATYDNPNKGTNKPVTIAYQLTGSSSNNYTLTNPTTTSSANITARQLYAHINVPTSKIYDGTPADTTIFKCSLTGLYDGDVDTVNAVATFNDKNAGTNKTITIHYSSGTNSNYISPVDSVIPNGTIFKRPTSVNPSTVSVQTIKTYDGDSSTVVLSAGTLVGKVGTDDITLSGSAKFDQANAGYNLDITVNYILYGDDVANYYTPDPVVLSGNGTIKKKKLTIATPATVVTTKVYDGTTEAKVTSEAVAAGVISGDNVHIVTTAEYLAKVIGQVKPIIVTYYLDGDENKLGNYQAPDTTHRIGSITKCQLYVSNTNVVKSKAYDGNDSAQVLSAGSLLNDTLGDHIVLSATARYDNANVGTNKNIYVTYTISGDAAVNYYAPITATYNDGEIRDVTPTVSGTTVDASKVYDGTTTANVTVGQMGGLTAGHTNVTLHASATYNDANVGDDKTVTVHYWLEGPDAGYYTAPDDVTFPSTIEQKQLTVSGTIIETDRVYDATDVARVTSVGNLVGKALSTDDVTLTAEAHFTNKNVGENKKINISYTISGAQAGNYIITPTDTTRGTISQYPLNIATDAVIDTTKVYDGNNNCNVRTPATIAAVLSGDDATIVTASPATYDNENVGTGKIVTVSYSLTGNDAANYSLNRTSSTKTASITKRQLTAVNTVVADDKAYDGNANAVITQTGSLATVVPGDNVTFTLLATYNDASVADNKTITLTYTLDGTDAANYIAPVTSYIYNARIHETRLSVVGTNVDASKVYDGNTTAVVHCGTLSGKREGAMDVYVTATAAYLDKNVGASKPVVITYQLTGSDAQYYVTPKNDTLSAEITQRSLTISATNIEVERLYDGTNTATVIDPGSINKISGDDVTLGAVALFDNKNVGSGKRITITYSLSGTDAANYFCTTQTTRNDGKINQLGIDIATEATVQPTKVYDANTECTILTQGTLSGVIGNDVVSLVAESPAHYTNSNVGTGKNVNFTYSLTGADAANYSLNRTTGSATADITGLKLGVMGTAVTLRKPYDGTTSAAVTNNGTLTGALGTVDITLTAIATYDNPNVGTGKTITARYTISGTDAKNYLAPDSTLFSGEIFIDAPTVSGTVVDTTKVYDGTTYVNVVNAGSLSGLTPGRTDVSVTAVAFYDTKDVGVGKTITVNYTLQGNDKDYYTTPASLQINTGCITKRPLTVTGTSIETTKDYDGTTSVQINDPGVINPVGTEDVTLSTTATYSTETAGTGKTINIVYSITGNDKGNYSSPANVSRNDGVINQRGLRLKKAAVVRKTKVYDGNTSCAIDTDGVLQSYSQQMFYGVLANETVDLTATATYRDPSAALSKMVDIRYQISGQHAANYYLLDSVGTATADITTKKLSAQDVSVTTEKPYDGNKSVNIINPARLDGLVSPDQVTLTTYAQYDSSAVGDNRVITLSYTISGTDAGNYSSPDTAYVAGRIYVVPLTVTGTKIDSAKVYDGTVAVYGVYAGQLNGVQSGDNVTLSATAEYGDPNQGDSKPVTVTFTLGGFAAQSYITPDPITLYAAITKKQLSVSGTQVTPSRVYDGTDTIHIINNGTLLGVINNEDVSFFVSDAHYDDGLVGNSKDVTVSYSLTGDDKDNYLAPLTATKTASITKKQLTARNTNVTTRKAYDGSTVAESKDSELNGVIGNDQVFVQDTANYSDPDVATGKTITVRYILSGSDAANYQAPIDSVITNGEIYSLGLIISGPTDYVKSKVYDGTTDVIVNSPGSLSGMIAPHVNVTLNANAYYETPVAGTSKTIIVVYSLSGSDAYYYAAPDTFFAYDGVITERPVSISGVNVADKLYDGNTSATVTTQGTITNKVAGDNLVVSTTATFDDPTVGSDKHVTLSYSLSGADAGNYMLDTVAGDAFADITTSSLTISGTTVNPSKTYDGTTACASTPGQLTGVKPGDDVQVVATATYSDKNVGNGKRVVISYTLTGADAANYVTPANDTLSADITKLPVILTGTQFAQSKVYDGTVAGPAVIDNGYLSGALDSTLNISVSAVYNDKYVGTDKPLTLTVTVTGTDAANYDVSDTQSLTADITPRPVTVSGSVANGKVYDGTTAATVAVHGTLSNVISGDAVSPVATAEFLEADAGNRPVALHFTLTGADHTNYTLASEYDTVYANITKKLLTVSGTQFINPKQYDGNDTCGVSNAGVISGLCANDSVTLSAVASYDTKEKGTGKTITASYTISGPDANNYDAPLTSSVTYGEITRRSISVTGTTVASSKVYDGNTDCQVTNVGTSSEIFPGDLVTISALATYDTKNVGVNKPVTVTYSVSGVNADDYDVQPDATLFADITCKPVTFTGTQIDGNKTYDGNTDATVLSVGTTSDTISTDSVVISATAHYDALYPTSNANVIVNYAITGVDGGNYCPDSVIFSNFTISAAQLTTDSVHVTNQRIYDGTNIAYATCGSTHGVFGSDSIVVRAYAYYDNKNVGTGKQIDVSFSVFGPDSAKYKAPAGFSIYNGVITVAPLYVDSTMRVDTLKMYDGLTTALVTQTPNLVGRFGQDVVILAASADFDNPIVGAGKTINASFSISGADAYNYDAPNGFEYTNQGRIFDEVVVNPSSSTDPSSKYGITTDASGYCPGDIVTLNYSIKSGNPYQYRVEFSNEAQAEGFANQPWSDFSYPADSIYFPIPADCKDGKYIAVVQFRNEIQARDNMTVTRRDTVIITVNLSQNYITDIFYDVVSIDNRENRFHTFQWYRDGNVLPGATLPYYNEIGGLDGVYSVKVNIGEATENMVCPNEFHHVNDASAPAYITAYPNPAVDELNLELFNFAEDEHNVRIVNQMGLGVISGKFDGTTYKVNVSTLPAGTYTVIVDGINVKVIKK